MSTTALEDVAWDLEPLVDGEGEDGVDRLLDEADARADAFAAPHAGKVAELDGPGLAAAMAELAAIVRRSSAAPAPTPACASPPTPPTPPTAR